MNVRSGWSLLVLAFTLALGLAPERAREISQAAWTRLMEKHAEGGLAFLRANGYYQVEHAAATLEDVFISLMPESPDAPQ